MSPLAPAFSVAAAWFSIVLLGAWLRRPRSTRVAGLLPSAGPVNRRRPAVERLGGVVRTAAHAAVAAGRGHTGSATGTALQSVGDGDGGHREAEDDGSVRRKAQADRRVGVTVVVAGIATVISIWLVPLIALGGWAVVSARRRAAARRRAEALSDLLPDVVDLFTLAAGAGLTVSLSVEAVARHAPEPIAGALTDVVHRQRLGERSADALARLPAEIGEGVRPLVNTLVASERYGTALVPALEALAGEAGNQRRRRAEERARRAPVKLIFPLVLCSLPAFALLTVVPLLLSTLGSLHF